MSNVTITRAGILFDLYLIMYKIMDRYRYRYGTVECLIVLFFPSPIPGCNICTTIPRIKKKLFFCQWCWFLDVSVVYNSLILNVGPPLGLIKYKKESFLLRQLSQCPFLSSNNFCFSGFCFRVWQLSPLGPYPFLSWQLSLILTSPFPAAYMPLTLSFPSWQMTYMPQTLSFPVLAANLLPLTLSFLSLILILSCLGNFSCFRPFHFMSWQLNLLLNLLFPISQLSFFTFFFFPDCPCLCSSSTEFFLVIFMHFACSFFLSLSRFPLVVRLCPCLHLCSITLPVLIVPESLFFS